MKIAGPAPQRSGSGGICLGINTPRDQALARPGAEAQHPAVEPCGAGYPQRTDCADALDLFCGCPQRRDSIIFHPFPDGSRKLASTLP
jgi:hypothetical protein